MLSAASKLGPYEVAGPLGAGGMGEVYRARDSRLGRVVAIKVLPANYSQDPERLRRFEQEARAAAALSHPNLLEIHDVGAQNGSPYIVTELLEGETLRERLRPGPLSVRKAIDYSLQVARGLAAAHEKGIVHRDLKPENIFITRDGRVKILDFGVAKLIETEDAVRTSAPTVETTPGVVLGTVGYMSPEQVRGQAADHRSDLFSFGAILYEMLSGRRAFKGETSADTMSSILKDDPPELTETNRNIPPALERIVRHCLEKNPEERFQSARDVAFNLESLSTLSSTSAAAAIAGSQHIRRRWLWAAGAALLAIVAMAAALRFAGGWVRPAQPEFRRVTFRNGTISAARFGPDGQTALYSAAWQSNPMELYSSPPGSVVGQSLGVKNAELLAVSRSGDLAVLLAPRVLYAWERVGILARVSATGGAKPEIDNIGSADFSPDGSSLAIARYVPEQKAFRIEYPAGKVLYETQAWISHLRISPDNDRIAFLEHPYPGDDLGSVAVVDLKGTKKTLTTTYNSVFGLAWAPSGREIWYTVANTIYAVDPSGKGRLVLRLPARMVLQDLARDGTVLVNEGIYRPGLVAVGEGRAQDLTWLDWPVLEDISKDGKTILFDEDGAGAGPGGYGVYIRGIDGSPAVKLGEGGSSVALSPDGQWVLSRTATPPNQFVLLPTGAGEPRQITHDSISHFIGGRFFPDGKRIVFSGQEAGHSPRTYVQEIDGGAARAITPEGTWGALLSPDAAWIIVSANKQPTLWPVAGGTPRPVAGLQSGESVLGWTSDGRLFVASTDNAAWRVTKLDPVGGRRESAKPIAVPPLAGFGIRELMLTPDGNAYAYRYLLQFMDLYAIKGLK